MIGAPQSINQTGLLLFDNRTDFVQGFAGVTHLLSARASFTISGNGFDVHRQSSELIGMEGYGGDASFQYRVSRITSIGAAYNRSHYQYPSYYGQTNLNNYSVFVGTQFGPLMDFPLAGRRLPGRDARPHRSGSGSIRRRDPGRGERGADVCG